MSPTDRRFIGAFEIGENRPAAAVVAESSRGAKRMDRASDVVVIGGGVIGGALAWRWRGAGCR